MKNPNNGVRSIVPNNGGTNPENSFKYGSVTCLRASQGCCSHQVNVGNQLSNTLTNKSNRYNCMKFILITVRISS